MFVDLDGTSVHYAVTGEGPGLVLVHGSSIDAATNFGHVVERFTDRRTVVTPDYAGSGLTPLSSGGATLELLVDQVVAATRDAIDEPVDLVGFSLGAEVAAAIAARHPDLVRRLVLVAGWTHLADARLRLGLETWGRLLVTDAELFATYGLLIGASPGFLAGLDDSTLAALRAMAPAPGTAAQIDLDLRVDIRADLARITAPTLVIGCSQDQLVPVRHARAVHRAIAGSRYLEIDSGHVVFAEQPDAVVRAVREFLFAEPDTDR